MRRSIYIVDTFRNQPWCTAIGAMQTELVSRLPLGRGRHVGDRCHQPGAGFCRGGTCGGLGVACRRHRRIDRDGRRRSRVRRRCPARAAGCPAGRWCTGPCRTRRRSACWTAPTGPSRWRATSCSSAPAWRRACVASRPTHTPGPPTTSRWRSSSAAEAAAAVGRWRGARRAQRNRCDRHPGARRGLSQALNAAGSVRRAADPLSAWSASCAAGIGRA